MKLLVKEKFRGIIAALFIIVMYIYFSKSGETHNGKQTIPKLSLKSETYTPVHKRVARDPTAPVHFAMGLLFDSNYQKEETIDFTRLGYQLRFYKELYHYLRPEANQNIPSKRISDAHEGINKKDLRMWIDMVDDQLFSWIKPGFSSTLDLVDSFKGDGIVVCVFDRYIELALVNLLIIREHLQSRLPIEIFYMGEKDLSLNNRKLLESTITMSKTIDIYKIFDAELIKTTGWSVKAFALLASSFQNAILIDADIVFLQPPENILESKLFQSNRALFYQDRTVYSVTLKMIREANNWVKELAPKPFKSEHKSNRFLKGQASHQQESGVVVIDKKARFIALLSTCILNVDRIRDVSYSHMYGDKETFWIGFELVEERYAFNPYLPGAMSEEIKIDEKGNSEICSVQLIHVDENYQPIWINGGLFLNKNTKTISVPSFRYYLVESNQKGNPQGTWSLREGWFFCLGSKNPPQELSESSLNVFEFAKPYLESITAKNR